MSTGQRIALFVGAVVVAAAAFVVLRPDDETDPASQTSSTPETQAEQGPSAPAGDEIAPEPSPEPGPRPELTRIRVRGGRPVGGAATVAVRDGEPIRLLVASDVADEVHVHGYDLAEAVGPGQPARLVFRADLQGVFEVELEQGAVVVAQLEVRP